jgi:hypothetical protein
MRYLFFVLLACRLSAQTATDTFEWHDRWDAYLQKTFSWKKIGVITAETAFDQTFQLNKCGRPPYCFPRDFEVAMARRTTRSTIELGVGALLGEDLRRRPSGLPGFKQRLFYALVHAPLARGSNGEWQPAYSRFAGTLGGIAVASAIRDRPIFAPRVLRDVGLSASAYFEDAVWTEFEPDMKRLAVRFARRLRHKDSIRPPAETAP